MGFTSLIPWAEADAQREQQQSNLWRNAQRQQTIAQYMTTANQIRRQLGYVDNIHKALAYLTDHNTGKPAAGQEQEVARLQDLLKQYNVDALHGNLNQVETYITKLYDPNFNAETGMPGRSPIGALGEKLHLVKPQQAFAQTLSTLPGQFEGQVTPGNIDLNKRGVVRNPDGSISTEQSMSFGTDQGEVLIPTVYDGAHHTNEEAIAHYRQTGEHLGIFDTPEHADAYAKSLHQRQDQYYHGGAAQQQKMTAGELIRGLRGIQQKYDVAAPGIETGEQELAGEEAQRERQRELEKDIAFKTGLAEKYGVDKEEIARAALTGGKPAAEKTQFEPVAGTVDGKPVNWMRNKYSTDPRDAVDVSTGQPVTPEQWSKFVPAPPKGSAGAGKKTQIQEQRETYMKSRGKTPDTWTWADEQQFLKERQPYGDQRFQMQEEHLRLAQQAESFRENYQNFEATQALRKDMTALEKIRTSATNADWLVTNHSGPGDNALVFDFIEATKPGGFRFNQKEYDWIQGARPFMEGLQQKYVQGLITGETLIPSQRQIMAQIIKHAASQVDEQEQRITGAAAPFMPKAAESIRQSLTPTAPTGGESPLGTIMKGRGGIQYRKSKAGPDTDRNTWEQVSATAAPAKTAVTPVAPRQPPPPKPSAGRRSILSPGGHYVGEIVDYKGTPLRVTKVDKDGTVTGTSAQLNP